MDIDPSTAQAIGGLGATVAAIVLPIVWAVLWDGSKTRRSNAERLAVLERAVADDHETLHDHIRDDVAHVRLRVSGRRNG